MLDSFVSTQKQSVQKAMQKKFRKFITSKVLRAPLRCLLLLARFRTCRKAI